MRLCPATDGQAALFHFGTEGGGGGGLGLKWDRHPPEGALHEAGEPELLRLFPNRPDHSLAPVFGIRTEANPKAVRFLYRLTGEITPFLNPAQHLRALGFYSTPTLSR